MIKLFATALLACSMLLSPAYAWAGDPSISLSFHLTRPESGKGAGLKKRFERETLLLERDPFLSINDFTTATVERTDTRGYNVIVHLSPDALERTRRVTREANGRRIAILIENEVVMAPVIRGEAQHETVRVAFGLTEVEAQLLAARINAEIHQRR